MTDNLTKTRTASALTGSEPGADAALAGYIPPLQGFPVDLGSRFEFLAELGSGGFGTICLAYDSRLQRQVALKFIRSKSSSDSELLLSEARIQAQVKHECICQIHEVVEADGQICLVMQYIDGQQLDKIAHRLNPEQLISIIERILRGLQQAHSQGVLHRDIKPSNILVEETAHGELKPYLIDFGIAYRSEQDTQQADTAGFGTPSFMAPEQRELAPVQLDRRVDIYAAGACLYSLLTTHAASPQESTERQALFPPPHARKDRRWPNIPADLQSIMVCCLQRNPDQRYASAKAMADDIARYLAGEPVRVHAGLGYRTKKRLVKHWLMASVLSLLVLSTTLGGSWMLYQQYQQQLREELIQRFTATVENMEARVRFAYMAPIHDLAPEIAGWRAEITALELEMGGLGEIAYGPGHYAIGRMHLAFQEYDTALQHLQLAWDAGFRQDRVAWALAMVNGAIYERQKRIAENLPSASARQDRLALLDQQYRLPAIDYLNQGMSASPQRTIGEATLFYYQGDYDAALAALEQEQDFPSWSYQQQMLAGDIHYVLAEQAAATGDSVQVTAEAEQAVTFYEQALAIAPSDYQLRLRPVLSYQAQLRSFLYGQMGNFQQVAANATIELEQAQAVNTQGYEALLYAAQTLSLLSQYEKQYSGNPAASLDTAIDKLLDASRLAPDNSDIWLSLGTAYRSRYEIGLNESRADNDYFTLTLSTLDKVAQQDRDYFYFNTLGNLLWAKGNEVARNDFSSAEMFYTRSAAAYDSATAIQPERNGAIINAGSVYLDWAAGLLPAQANQKMDLAIAKYRAALALNGENFVANYYLAVGMRRKAILQDLLGMANSTTLEQARFYLSQAESINPGHPFIANAWALLLSDQALYGGPAGTAYQPIFEAAIGRLDAALASYPDNATLQATRAELFFSYWSCAFFDSSRTAELDSRTEAALAQGVLFAENTRVLMSLMSILRGGRVDVADTVPGFGGDWSVLRDALIANAAADPELARSKLALVTKIPLYLLSSFETYMFGNAEPMENSRGETY